MVLTTTTLDRTVDGSGTSTVLGTSPRACAGSITGNAMSGYQQLVDHRATAELRASFVEGRVWLRPATDVIVPTTPGHLACSPPT